MPSLSERPPSQRWLLGSLLALLVSSVSSMSGRLFLSGTARDVALFVAGVALALAVVLGVVMLVQLAREAR